MDACSCCFTFQVEAGIAGDCPDEANAVIDLLRAMSASVLPLETAGYHAFVGVLNAYFRASYSASIQFNLFPRQLGDGTADGVVYSTFGGISQPRCILVRSHLAALGPFPSFLLSAL